MDRGTVDGRNGDGQSADIWTAGGRNDDRQLAGKEDMVGRRTDRQTDCRGIGGQPAVETMVDSRRKNKDDRQTDRQMDEMVTDCRRINGQPAKLVN